MTISESRDEYGYIWTYRHSDDEPHDTLVAAIMIAAEVAATEARNEDQTYVVASAHVPSPVIYALPFGHPLIAGRALSIMYQLTADGRCIRSPKPQEH